MQISIILATYNWPQALNIILNQLAVQLVQYPNVELIIADDGSTTKTAEVIAKYQQIISRCKHIWHPDNGFQKSIILNKAVAAANGEYLIFLDGDCIPFPDYLSQHIKLIEAGYFVAGNRVLLSKPFTEQVLNNKNLVTDIFTWGNIKWMLAKFSKKVNKISAAIRLKGGKWRYSRRHNWKYPKGCNFAMFKEDFLAVNGFDEEFCGWGHEDADLFVRLLHNGIKIKDGRFAIPVLHLWHKHEDRNNEAENSKRLLQRVNDPEFKQAVLGVKQWLPS